MAYRFNPFTGIFDNDTISVGGGGGSAWGGITGTLSDQTDLQTALDAKVDLAGDTMTGKLTINQANSGQLALEISLDESTGAQPAAYIHNNTNWAVVNSLVKLELKNGTDSGAVLQLINPGTGAAITTGTNQNLKIAPNGTGYTIIGDAGITSHSFDTNDDLFVSGRLEVDGAIYADSSITAAGSVTGSNLSGSNTGDQTSVSGNAGTATKLAASKNIDGQAFDGSANITVIAPGTHAATGKTTPVDADEMPLVDSGASSVLKKLTWANLKATIKTYTDTLYPSGSGTSSGTNTGDQTLPTGGTPALTLGITNTAGSSPNFLRRDDTILAFDATAPSTQAYGDSAAVGVATVAARRDHKHAMPASTKDTTAQTGILKGNGSTISAVTAPTGTIVGTSDSQTLTNKVLTSPTITTEITPIIDGGASLGTTSLKFSNVFLASGGVINFNSGDVTITHSASVLTINHGSLIVYQSTTDAVAQVVSDTLSDARSRLDLLGNAVNGRGKLIVSGAHSGFDGTQNADGAAVISIIHDNQAGNPKKFAFTTAGSPAQLKLDIENNGSGGTVTGIMRWFADGGVQMGYSGGKIGFLDKSPITKPTVTGSKGANAALTSLLTALANLGLVTDSST